MHRLVRSVARELRELAPIWLFFFLAFSLLRLTQTLIIRQYGIHATTPSLVLVGSLIVAKTFMIVELFSFVGRYHEKPLIYDVVWKTGIYYLAALVIYFVEQLIELTIRHHSAAFAWTDVTSAAATPHFWVGQLWFLLLLFAFTAGRETSRAIGKGRVAALWFGGREPPSQESSPRRKAA